MPRGGFNRFPELSHKMGVAIAAAVSETVTAIEQDVKGGPNAAPYITGNLRRSYHSERRMGAGGPEGEVGNDPAVAEYAVYVEYGTSKMAAQPHLRPATMEREGPFRRMLEAIVGGRL